MFGIHTAKRFDVPWVKTMHEKLSKERFFIGNVTTGPTFERFI